MRENGDFRIPTKLNAQPVELLFQPGHEAIRREMTVLREINSARGIHGDTGIEFGELFWIKHLRGYAQFVCLRSILAFVIQRLLSFAEHDQSSLDEAKVVVRQLRQFFKARAAGKLQIT